MAWDFYQGPLQRTMSLAGIVTSAENINAAKNITWPLGAPVCDQLFSATLLTWAPGFSGSEPGWSHWPRARTAATPASLHKSWHFRNYRTGFMGLHWDSLTARDR